MRQHVRVMTIGLLVLVLVITGIGWGLQDQWDIGRGVTPQEIEVEVEDCIEVEVLFSKDDLYSNGVISVLLVGVDTGEFPRGGYRPGPGRSDSLIIAQFNGENKTLTCLSIPRDTLVNIPGHGQDKINHAHVYGDVELTIQTVEEFTGIPIHRFVVLDYKGFEGIVDALGGVEIDVDKSFVSMRLQFEPGVQRLNGHQAYAFIRFRGESMGDLARVQRQQRFMHALLAEAAKKHSLTQYVQLFVEFNRNGKTDFSVLEVIKLMNRYGGKLNRMTMVTHSVPGSFYDYKGVSYWKPEPNKLKAIVNEHFTTLEARQDDRED